MTDYPHPSGRPDSRRVAIASPPWPVHCFLLIMAALCAVAALRSRPPAAIPDAPQTGSSAEIVPQIASYEPPPPPAGAEFELVSVEQPAPPPSSLGEPYDIVVRLPRGNTPGDVLDEIGIADDDRVAAVTALEHLLKKRRLAAGEKLKLSLQPSVDADDYPLLLSLQVRPEPEREYVITRQDDGSYDGDVTIYKVHPRIVRVATRRVDSLLASGVRAGAPADALREFIKALSYDVDFERELKPNAPFALLLEEGVTSDGRLARPGRLLAGELELTRRSVTVIAFTPLHGARQFYTPDGNSVVRAFLRTPMDASHISSPFGRRRHPILGYSRMHEGVDFAAPKGTPILAAGRGTVVRAGYYGGYGLYVELQHTATIATAYGHMSRLGRGIRPGVHVHQGQVMGYVGATGLATGPHLHYEFHRRGRPVNPLTQRASIRRHLAGSDLKRFTALVRQYRAQLHSAPLIGAALH
ncbi:MAG: M23 family metallopeptidase [Proteobacteria bacterium]|nr:M23 family metallopeptidase [Pseudomonadota bacterium]